MKTNLLLGIFATANLTKILVYAKIAEPVRELVGIEHNDEGQRIGKEDNFLANLLWCNHCVSIWMGFILTVILFANEKLYRFLTTALTFSWLGTFLDDRS